MAQSIHPETTSANHLAQSLRGSLTWHRFLMIAVSILLVAFFVRTVRLSTASIWIDEYWTLERINGDMAFTLEHTARPGNQVPLFFIIANVFQDDHPFSPRYVSALGGLLAVALAIGILRQGYGWAGAALFAGALLALYPFHIDHSRDSRPYAWLSTFILWSSWAFMRTLKTGRGWHWLVLASALGYLTHITALVLLGAQFLAIALWHKPIRERIAFFWRWGLAQALAIIPMVLWFVFFITNSADASLAWIRPPADLRGYVTMILKVLGGWHPLAVSLPVMALIIAGIAWAAWMTLRRRAFSDIMWFAILIAPYGILFLMTLFIRPALVERYILVSIPAAAVLAGIGWHYLPRWRGLPIQAGLATVILAGAILMVGLELVNSRFERQGWADAIAHIEDQLEPGDALILPVNRYIMYQFYDGDTSILPADEDLARQLIAGEADPSVLNADRIWLLYLTLGDPPMINSPLRDQAEPVAEYNNVSIERIDMN